MRIFPKIIDVFERGSNAAWPFRGEPSSGHAVPTAAMHSVKVKSATKCPVTAL